MCKHHVGAAVSKQQSSRLCQTCPCSLLARHPSLLGSWALAQMGTVSPRVCNGAEGWGKLEGFWEDWGGLACPGAGEECLGCRKERRLSISDTHSIPGPTEHLVVATISSYLPCSSRASVCLRLRML
jgi:hypothetical protein